MKINQAMRVDGVPWRGAREKRHKLFSIIFSNLTDKDNIIMDWQCDVGLFFISLFLNVLFFLILSAFSINFCILTSLHFIVLGGLSLRVIPFNAISWCSSSESPMRVLTTDIFATPLTMLELPSYAIKLAH